MDEYRNRVENDLVPFAHLVTISQAVKGDVDAASQVLEEGSYRNDTVDREALARNLVYARNWAEKWAPESYKVRLLTLPEAREAAESLDQNQLDYLDEAGYWLNKLVSAGLSQNGEVIQNVLYETSKEMGLSPRKAFVAIYTVLIGRTNGPKAGPYIAQISTLLAAKHFLRTYRNDVFGKRSNY
jgi:lysyl-tRNA synthetase class 1